MTDLNTIWANTQADGNTEDAPPPAGTVGIARVASHRTGKSKRGELYFAVDLVDDTQNYRWGVYKQFTKNGQPHEGSIKSAKITLRQLGLEVASPDQLTQLLPTVEGRYYTYDQAASDRINQVTGFPYVNTNITGVASGPPQAAPVVAPVVQAPTVVHAPAQTLEQAIVAGQVSTDPQIATQVMQQQVAAAVATQTDDHPFK